MIARRYNIPVKSITLFIFGGVSDIAKEPQDFHQEFKMSIAGPLTSLGLGAIFAVLWWLVSHDGINSGNTIPYFFQVKGILFYGAIANETSEDITLMLDTLSKITIVFIGEEFNEIKSVNEWIENKHKDVSEGKKSTTETIKQHRHIVTLLISFGIIVAGGILAYSTRFIKSDISVDTQILVWVGISVPFVIWCIIARQRR